MGSNAGVQIKSGTAHNIVVHPPRLTVKEITFISDVDIWYAEIPDRNTTFIVPDRDDVGQFFDPPEIRPLSGDPHWRKSIKNDMPELSLPVVYIQEGTEIDPSHDIRVSFEAGNWFSGRIYIRATSISGIKIAEQGVNFTNGKADSITFKMHDLPDTVSCYPGFSFEWEYRMSRSSDFKKANPTQHTFFIINDNPSNMNIPPHNKPIFEIFNWACNWASGYFNQEIVGAIWWHFSPIQRTHETGFIYAKNWYMQWHLEWHDIKPAKDLIEAIQLRNDKDRRKRNGVSSRVFNSIFINCLAVHGIKSAEIKISLPQNPFRRDGVDYKCKSWRSAICMAQGSINPPKKLNEHWIADVVSDSGIWQIYDATYGFGPFNSQKPGSSRFINLEYESSIVYSFECERISDGEIIDLPYNPDPNIQPHLVSEVVWQS